MINKSAVFVIGVYCKSPTAEHPLLDTDMELLGRIADKAGLDAQIVFAIDNPKFAAFEKKVRATHTKAAHEKVAAKINALQPDIVVAFGRVALGVLKNTGPATLKPHKRKANKLKNIDAPVFVTDSLSRVVVQPGVRKWLELDVLAAVQGYNESVPGEHTILTPDMPEWSVMPDEFKQVEEVGFDLETFPGTSPWDDNARIRMAILAGTHRRSHVIQTERGQLPVWVQDILSDPSIVKGGSNIAFDYGWCKRFGYDVVNMHDTITAEHVMDPLDPYKDLKHIALRYEPALGDYDAKFEKLRKKRGGWEYIEDEEMFTYAGCDGEASYAAMVQQRETIREMGLSQAWKLSSDLYPVLADIQAVGMAIDKDTNAAMAQVMEDKLAALTTDIQAHLGPINPASATQMAKALTKTVTNIDLREHTWRRILVEDDEDEDISTKRIVLEREAHKHPVIPLVLEHRVWFKLHGTYIKGLREKYLTHHGGQDYIHPRFTLSTETYRLASSYPSAHQIPRKSDNWDLNVKRQFISRFPNGLLLNADYSQMEMRIAAQESGDRALIDAISKEDVHRTTAALMFRREAGAISDDMRTAAKTIGFATLYGAGKGRISKLLGTTQQEAQDLIGAYFRVYPRLRQFINETYAYVEENLEVTTPFGFKRQFIRPPWGLWQSFEGARVKRQGFNTTIQSTAACVMYCALIELHARLKGMDSELIGTVHDSLMVDSPPGELETVQKLVYDIMSDPPTDRYGYQVTVPLGVDMEVGKNWGELKKVA